jgi:hypothetical protein
MITRAGGSAIDVPPSCRMAATGAAVEPDRALSALTRPGFGRGNNRGDDLARAQRTKRSAAQRSRAQRRERAAGQFVQWTVGRGHATDIRVRVPGYGTGRVRQHRRHSRPGRIAKGMEARQGRDAEHLAAARCEAREPGPRSGFAQVDSRSVVDDCNETSDARRSRCARHAPGHPCARSTADFRFAAVAARGGRLTCSRSPPSTGRSARPPAPARMAAIQGTAATGPRRVAPPRRRHPAWTCSPDPDLAGTIVEWRERSDWVRPLERLRRTVAVSILSFTGATGLFARRVSTDAAIAAATRSRLPSALAGGLCPRFG